MKKYISAKVYEKFNSLACKVWQWFEKYDFQTLYTE